ncbi:MAG: hypothetical protein WCV85_01840 [Patescibacteria group bacterium]|jgi:hypothetical protein
MLKAGKLNIFYVKVYYCVGFNGDEETCDAWYQPCAHCGLQKKKQRTYRPYVEMVKVEVEATPEKIIKDHSAIWQLATVAFFQEPDIKDRPAYCKDCPKTPAKSKT